MTEKIFPFAIYHAILLRMYRYNPKIFLFIKIESLSGMEMFNNGTHNVSFAAAELAICHNSKSKLTVKTILRRHLDDR